MREWLETDGLGGFASGVDAGPRTRRYHALLISARRPPVKRVTLVNGVEAWIEVDGKSFPITTQKYAPNTIHPDGYRRLEKFSADPWPSWMFRTEDDLSLRQEIFMVHGRPATVVRWEALGAVPRGATLVVRPLLSGRDFHGAHKENPAFNFSSTPCGGGQRWQTYPDIPAVTAHATGTYEHKPLWYQNFLYDDEKARGVDATEDLGSPGVFRLPLDKGPVSIVFTSEEKESLFDVERIRMAEKIRRSNFSDRLSASADAYLAKRGSGSTIIAGFPWFGDYGRDSFISLRGLCLALGRLKEAEGILLEWAGAVVDGLVPNRFPDDGEKPEYNSVDASLCFIVAVNDYFRACKAAKRRVNDAVTRTLQSTCESILTAYRKGTHFGIQMSFDGLLASGVPESNLTWMDAKNGGHAFTPRIGKPVEVQALWLAALMTVSNFSASWARTYEKALASFRQRFWNPDTGGLFDVVDVNHALNVNDAAFRPNQIFAVGGLPWTFLELDRARTLVDNVERRLLTRLGLRSLAADEPGYRGRYEGGPYERDASYHQGTVWLWLIGPFVEAWVRTHGDDARARRDARSRFLQPFFDHLKDAGLGHLSEIADGDFPHTPRGCPFQAWSLAELLRLDRLVLAEPRA